MIPSLPAPVLTHPYPQGLVKVLSMICTWSPNILELCTPSSCKGGRRAAPQCCSRSLLPSASRTRIAQPVHVALHLLVCPSGWVLAAPEPCSRL